MLLAGDEMGRTQQGNNNAYCQDNEITWLDWSPEAVDDELSAFVRSMISFSLAHPLFRRRHFFQGRAVKGADVRDIVWFEPSGAEMSDQAWEHDHARCLGVRYAGAALQETTSAATGWWTTTSCCC